MLLLCAMIIPAMSQITVGVQVGDWFLYKGTLVQWQQADDTVTFPPFYATYLQDWNETNWMNYTVTAVSADMVNFSVYTSWKNGSFTTAALSDNLTSSSDIVIIGANLTAGALIRGPDFLNAGNKTLNATIPLVTTNGTRQTNVLNYSTDFMGSLYKYVYYWDQILGCTVYREYTGIVPTGSMGSGYNYTGKFELINSKSGVIIPDLTGPILLLTLMAITVPIVLLHRRKKLLI